MSQNENSVSDEVKGRRSPISPILPIDEAIEKARQAYAKDKRAFTDFKTLAGHLGYKVEKKGGRSGRTVSTLKQYGLLDERDGKYRISDTAWKILEMPEGSEERARLIKESALRPPMIRKVLDFFNGELPSDATLRSHLLFTEGFNTDSAADFIRVLRRTIELVNPLPGDYNAGEESEGAEPPPSGATPMSSQPPQGSSAGRYPAPLAEADRKQREFLTNAGSSQPMEGQLHFPLYLSKNQKATLSVPAEMSPKQFKLLKQQIANSLAVMQATVVVEDEQPTKDESDQLGVKDDLDEAFSTDE
jgi:hypothetical protein